MSSKKDPDAPGKPKNGFSRRGFIRGVGISTGALGSGLLETAALAVHPHLPDWWNIQDKKGSTPFEIALLFLGIGLAMTQILTNKSLLNRAHREFSA